MSGDSSYPNQHKSKLRKIEEQLSKEAIYLLHHFGYSSTLVGILFFAIFVSFAKPTYASVIYTIQDLFNGVNSVRMSSVVYPNKCVDDSNGAVGNGNPVWVWDCMSGNTNQNFQIVPVGGSIVNIKFKGYCLDVTYSGTTNGTKVWLWPCWNDDAQAWVPQTNGSFVNPHSNRCLTMPSTNNGSQFVIWDCNVPAGQLWNFTDFNESSSSQISDPTPIPTQAQAATPAPVQSNGDTTLQMTLLLQAVGNGGDQVNVNSQGNMNPLHQDRTVTLEIFNSQNFLVKTVNADVAYDSSSGSFKGVADFGTGFTSGAYLIKIKSAKYLRSQANGIQNITAGTTNTLDNTTLVLGDINGDNVISILDYNILMGCFSDLTAAVSCTPTQNDEADLNDDGAVNQIDYNLFIRGLSAIHG